MSGISITRVNEWSPHLGNGSKVNELENGRTKRISYMPASRRTEVPPSFVNT